MKHEVSQLRLAAIVAIDVAGYSARAAANEDGAVAEVAALAEQIAAACSLFGGRVFNTAGDGFMLEFPTVSGALAAAEHLAASATIPVRVGVHLGEVHVTPTGDLLGHGVNVAARLQARASPGSVLASSDVRRATRGRLAERLVARGVVPLDPPDEAMPVFALDGAPLAAPGPRPWPLGIGGRGDAAAKAAAGAAVRSHPAWSSLRLPVLIGLAACVLAILGVAAMGLVARLAPGRPQGVALAGFQPIGGGAAARSLADALSYEVAGSVANTGVKVIGPDGRTGGRAENLVLGGRVESAGTELRFTTELEDAHDHTVLWSARFTGAADKPAALEEKAAAKLADVLHCALDAANFPGGKIASDTLQTYLRACDLGFDDASLDQVRDLYRKVAAQQPGFSRPWSRLAYASALAAFSMQPDQARAARQEARLAARSALRINPKDGLAYEALADAGLGELRWDQLYALFERGLAVEPNNPKLLEDESQLLLRMGRIDDAIELSQRAVALDAFSVNQRLTLVEALLAGHRVEEARAAVDRSLRLWPQDEALRGERVAIEARYGDAGRARDMLGDAELRPAGWSQAKLASIDRVARARSGGALARPAFVRDELAAFEAGQLSTDAAILDLSNVGATEAAFRVAARIRSTAPRSTPGEGDDAAILWPGFSEPLRRDPRFMTLAAKLGLVDFWRTTGMWPDICSVPNWPYDCRALAARTAIQGDRGAGSTVASRAAH